MSNMHVTKCEECGCEITLKTDRCLNCGEKISTVSTSLVKGFTRKLVFILAAVYMLLTAIATFWK